MVAAANGVIALELPDEWREIATARMDLRALTDLPATADDFLTSEEQSHWRQLAHPHRRAEWLAARVCLKSLLFERGAIVEPRQVAIVKNDRGRPAVNFGSKPLPGDCSLAHSNHLAGAAWTSRTGMRLGLDIEQISPRLKRAAGAYLNRADFSAVPREELQQLTVWWTLKEAASKAWGLGLGAGLAEIACRETEPQCHRIRHTDGKSAIGWHCEFGEFVLTLCLSGDAA